MRHPGFLALGIILAAPLAHSAEAAALRPPGIETPASPGIVEVAVRCGPGAHYVRGHRARDGRYVRGHCVRNHRR